MQNLALNRSIVLDSRNIYLLFDQFERVFKQNFPHILRNHIQTKNCACGTKGAFLQLCICTAQLSSVTVTLYITSFSKNLPWTGQSSSLSKLHFFVHFSLMVLKVLNFGQKWQIQYLGCTYNQFSSCFYCEFVLKDN